MATRAAHHARGEPAGDPSLAHIAAGRGAKGAYFRDRIAHGQRCGRGRTHTEVDSLVDGDEGTAGRGVDRDSAITTAGTVGAVGEGGELSGGDRGHV
jgi:hypothetical protein